MRKTRATIAVATALALGSAALPAALLLSANAAPPVGQGFTVTPSDLSYILKQIKISESHVANTTPATGPCGALLGTGPNQLPSPLLSFGLRTVDGSCNNLVAGQEQNGAADQLFPRLAAPVFKPAGPAVFGPPRDTSYAQTTGSVFDTEPRIVSNLIVDQTSTNPAAIAAAGFPVRTQGNPGVVPCTTEPDPLADPVVAAVPLDCTPKYQTLFIPNVTTDVGLSPPYNSLFTLFGQFFDHGIDQTVKGGGGTVFVPLKDDDPLVAGKNHVFGDADDLDPALRFMVLSRARNQPGPDGIQGNGDDVHDAKNTDSPWVDQSQTYSSHASHQAFLREYVNSPAGRPVATGKLLGGTLPAGAPAGQDSGMATWQTTKAQAATLLGLALADKDVLDVPMLAVDAYGNFVPGPLRGLPQYATASGLVEGNTAAPVTVPTDALHFDTPFLTDIAHNAEPKPGLVPDDNSTASADFAAQPAGTYDDEMLNAHFIAGDGRVNENIGLTAIHQVFHSEHDRLVGDIESTLAAPANAALLASYQDVDDPANPTAHASTFTYGERIFQVARFVTEMEYQHLVFEEFARKVQPAINPFEPFAFTQTDLNPAVRAEFAHAVYRFGHSMLNETISRRNLNGTDNDIPLLKGFLNPPSYTDGGAAGTLTSAEAAGSIIMGMSDQIGNELDEFVTDTLRNNLLGLPLDLPTVNMARARSEGVPPLNVLRRDLFNRTNDGQLTPYRSWVDFGENIKHPESLVNFVAAYGKHPTIIGATTLAGKRAAAKDLANPVLGDINVPADQASFMNSTGSWANTGTTSITGLDNIDLWVGGLAENTTPFGGLLGTTFNYVFENQLTDLQNGDRLYYLARTPGMNLRTQLEGNSFAELMGRNTDVNTLKADAFATADCKFQLANLHGTPAGFTDFGNTVADDPSTACKENLLLLRQPDGTIQYRAVNGVDPPGINGQSVYNGTPGVDRIRGGNDNDTFWGGLGNDVIEGGGGADVALGGEGDDIITDLAGDDVPKGGPGNDAIDAGPGLDIIMAGEGKDFTNGGANANETFGGAGDDFIYLGQSLDAAFGDSGNDWEEGGDQPDLMQGDSGNLFFLDDSQLPGSDILIGQGGDDDYDMEGGDDIGVGGSGIEKVAGGSGFDWEIGQGEPQAQDMDLALPIPPLGILQVGVRDKFNEAEALSGWKFNDTLRGDAIVPAAVGGAGAIGCDVLDQAGLDRIAGLDALVPPLDVPLTTVVAQSASKDCPILTGPNVWGAGNILLGGAGSDLIEGRGGNDIIDGDRYLSVRLSVRDANNPANEIGSASIEGPGQSAMTSQYLRDGAGNLTGPTLQQDVFAGKVNPGNIVAMREVLTPAGDTGIDTALFSGARVDYDVVTTADGLTVSHARGAATDGTDTVRNVEKLQFADQTVTLAVPAAMATPTAVAGNSSATVSWTALAQPAGSLALLRYEIVSGSTAAGAAVPAPVTASIAATSAPVAGLTNGAAYTFQVRAVNDFGAGPLSAPSNSVTPARPAAPTVTLTSPGSNVTGADPVGNITATFSSNVTGVTGAQFTLRLGTSATGTIVSRVVTYDAVNRLATLNPNATLAGNTTYTARLLSSIVDGTGQPLAPMTWSFTTGAVNPPPTVAALTPAANAVGVPRAGNISMTFSEPVTGVTSTTVRLQRVSNGNFFGAVVSYNPVTGIAVLNPNVTLPAGIQFRVVVVGTAVTPLTDSGGAPIARTVWTFTTGP